MGRRASSQQTGECFRAPRPLARATGSLAAAALAACVALVVSPRVPLLVTVGFLVWAGLRALSAGRERARFRHQADSLLQTGVRVHPQSRLLVWRAAELTANRNRRAIARSLRGIVCEAGRPSPFSAVPLNRRGVRPHLGLLRVLADRVGSLERPVAARGMVLVEQLLTDGLSSPLYRSARSGDLPSTVGECLEALERDEWHASSPGEPQLSTEGREATSVLRLSSGGGL
jgi:hypothetical protein